MVAFGHNNLILMRILMRMAFGRAALALWVSTWRVFNGIYRGAPGCFVRQLLRCGGTAAATFSLGISAEVFGMVGHSLIFRSSVRRVERSA